MDNMEINAVANSDDLKGKNLTSKVVANKCEAVITGKLTPEAFDIIADDDITRYDGRGLFVQDALSRMDRNALKLIKNVEGTDECDSKHTENSCDGHHE
jgi:predicted Fe-Mo cluster-binding NifX family protein